MIFYMYSIILTFFLVLIMFTISHKSSVKNYHSLSPFECGFSTQLVYRTSFSLHFFLVALLFLIFDMELIIMFPLLMLDSMKMNFFNVSLSFLFLLTLLIGLVYEWNLNSLEWISH